MNKGFIKTFAIIFLCFLATASFDVGAQETSKLKINSVVKSNTFLGANIYVKGEALPNSNILLSIKDEKDGFAYSVKTNVDANGNWLAKFDQSLKSGKYYIEAIEKNIDGAQIESATFGPIEIKGSFVFIVAIFSFLVIILLAGFVGGWYINKIAEIKRYRRILMCQRDIIASYNVLKKDVQRALKNLSGAETEFLLKRINENLEKMNKYVLKGITIIGKYDIVKKAENFFKKNKN